MIDDLVSLTTVVARVLAALAEGELSQKMALNVEGQPVKGDCGRRRAPRGTDRGRGQRVIACIVDELDVRRTASGAIVELSKGWSGSAEN